MVFWRLSGLTRDERIMVTLAALIGLVQAVCKIFFLDPDGLSYLDLSDTVLSHRPEALISGYWSPFLPLVLAAGRGILRPNRFWEVPVFHLMLLLIYLAALLFFTVLQRRLQREFPSPDDSRTRRIRTVLAYTVFLWTQVGLIGVGWTTPDTLVTCVVLAAALCWLRWRRSGAWRDAALFAVVLASGYWVKAALLPIGLLWMGVATLRSEAGRRLRFAAVAGWAFVAVAGPLVLLTSLHAHAFSTGSTGALNYAWCVNGAHRYTHWQGDAAHVALHATQTVLDEPAMYVFRNPIGGTYPPWYEPAYWYAGLKPRWDARQQVQSLSNGCLNLAVTLFGWRSSRVMILVLGVAGLLSRRIAWRSLLALVPLWLPSVLAIVLYVGVVLLPRYVAPFLLVIGALAAASVTSPDGDEGRLMGIGVVLGCAVICGGLCLRIARQGFLQFAIHDATDSPRPDWAIAEFLHRQGVPERAEVGSVGYEFSPFWARLAAVRVVAEVSDTKRYSLSKGQWNPSLLVQDSNEAIVLGAFERLGVCSVVGRRSVIGGHSAAFGWTPVPGTDALVWASHRPCLQFAR